MKKHIIHLLSLAALALAGWSCETDYYNEHELDGYEPENGTTDVQNIEYTLRMADYATIADNKTNQAIAEAAGQEAIEALNNIKINGCFASSTDAQTYIRSFVTTNYPYLSSGSSVSVSYRVAGDVPAEMQAMNAAASYTLTDENYKTVWGEETPVSALTPATIGKLKEVLPSEGLEAGQYLAVTYNWLAEEPSTGGDEPVGPDDPQPAGYTSVLGSAKLDEAVEVKGYVSAVCTQGVIVTDETGSILVYKAADLAVGDEVTVEGTISSYNKGFQFDTTKGAVCTKTGTKADGVTYPAPTVIDGAALDALLGQETDEYAKFVKIEGTVAVTTNSKGDTYYNFNVEGAAKATGSFYGLSDELKSQLKEGEKITLYGYFSSISKQSGEPKFINVIVTKIGTGAPAAGDYTTVLGSAKLDDELTVKGYVAAACTQGVVVTDNSGSVFVYNAKDIAVGEEVTVKGKLSHYNKGFQFSLKEGATIENTGKTSVQHPAAVEMTSATLDAEYDRTDDALAQYVKVSGTYKVSVSGAYTNYNIIVDNVQKSIDVSIYGITDEVKNLLAEDEGKTVTLYGYYVAIAGSSSKHLSFIVTNIEGKNAAALRSARAAAKSEKRYAFYKWDGAAFSAADVTMVQPADYDEMGQTYGSFTDPDQDIYLPKFLNKTYPYAAADQTTYVAYRRYLDGNTTWVVDKFMYDGTSWSKISYINTENAPYKKTGSEWKFDPSRTIVLNPDKSEFSKKYYQAVVDWVYNNKNEKYTYDDRKGIRITNAEYYSGCATGYTNLNWRINTLPKYYWSAAGDDVSAYEKYTSDNVEESKAAYEAFYAEAEKRFGESMSAALGILHADQKMIAGIDVIYTLQMMLYTQHIGSSTGRVTHAFEFKLVADGTFEYVRMYALEDQFELLNDENWK